MTEKRFTLTYEKIGKYFDIGIVDHEEPFDDTTYEFHQCSFQDSKDKMEDLCLLLNALHEENVKLRARNKYLATKIQRERNIHVKEHEKWEEEIQKENEQLKSKNRGLQSELQIFKEDVTHSNLQINKLADENEQLKEEINYFERKKCEYFNKYNKKHLDNIQLKEENEQLKTTISRLIEQNRKNNDLLVSDIRLLEKALWCPNCTRNIKRLKELKKEFEND